MIKLIKNNRIKTTIKIIIILIIQEYFKFINFFLNNKTYYFK